MNHSLYKERKLDAARAQALRLEVEAFNSEYCAVLDTGEIESWPAFFTQNCIYRITARENAELGLPVGLIYAEGRGMLHDRAVAIAKTQMFAPRYMLHLVTNTRVTDESSAGTISSQSNFLLLQTLVEGPTTIHMAGTYQDRFVRDDASLLLKERQVIYDTTIIANDVVYPV